MNFTFSSFVELVSLRFVAIYYETVRNVIYSTKQQICLHTQHWTATSHVLGKQCFSSQACVLATKPGGIWWRLELHSLNSSRQLSQSLTPHVLEALALS